MQNLYIDTKYMMARSLESMAILLRKIQAEVAAKGQDEQELVNSQLFHDMFPLKKQIQIMSDNAKGTIARLAGLDVPSMADMEETLIDLAERLEKTLHFVNSVADEQLQDADTRKIVLPYFADKYQTAEDYVRDFAIPNFYFHTATAYGILRMKGHSIGKRDFLGSLHLRDL